MTIPGRRQPQFERARLPVDSLKITIVRLEDRVESKSTVGDRPGSFRPEVGFG